MSGIYQYYRPGGIRISANPLSDLVNLPPADQQRLGVSHTPGEIWRQSDLWTATAERSTAFFGKDGGALRAVLADERARIILTGAGSSHFVGDCLAQAIGHATGRVVMSIESTEIVAHPEVLRGPGPLVLVSFARSGESPESVGVYNLAKRVVPDTLQMVVTCNGLGTLAKKAAADGYPCLTLHPLTNDQGLAMTCSFTNLLVAGLGLAYLGAEDLYQSLATTLAAAGRRLLGEAPGLVAELVSRGLERAVFLGTGPLLGGAREAALKMMEMTDGAIPTIAQSYLAVRHGPLSFITERTLIVAFRSGEAYVRLYEDGLLTQLATKGFDRRLLAVEAVGGGDAHSAGNHTIGLFDDGPDLPDAWLPPLAVPIGQVLALLASLKLGCRPDQPSRTGLIHRVVEGVVMHDTDWPGYSS